MALQVGILGFGFATATFHAPLIAATPGLNLVAISSSNPAKVQAAWPNVTACHSAADLLARPEIDLVVIPTPNDTHHTLACEALAAGKHVVVDKPFTLTLAQAIDLTERAAHANRLLSVFHNRRWDADFLTVQRLLQDPRAPLGRVVHFESHFDRYRPVVRSRWREAGGPGSGLWYDLGPHLLDQALQLFGTPSAIQLDLARQRDGALADDWFHAVLRFPGPDGADTNPLRVVLHASALVGQLGPRFAVHGTGGSYIKYGLDQQEDQLKADPRAPGAPQWGHDPVLGHLTRWESPTNPAHSEPVPHRVEWPNLQGDYTRYYAAVRDAMVHGGPNPVPPDQATEVMRWIESGHAEAVVRQRTVKNL